MGCDLATGVGEGVECIVYFFFEDLVLDGDFGGDEYVIEGFGLEGDVQLLNTVGRT